MTNRRIGVESAWRSREPARYLGGRRPRMHEERREVLASEHGGEPYLAPYVAAKAGLAGLTRNAAHAHRWDKIRIN